MVKKSSTPYTRTLTGETRIGLSRSLPSRVLPLLRVQRLGPGHEIHKNTTFNVWTQHPNDRWFDVICLHFLQLIKYADLILNSKSATSSLEGWSETIHASSPSCATLKMSALTLDEVLKCRHTYITRNHAYRLQAASASFLARKNYLMIKCSARHKVVLQLIEVSKCIQTLCVRGNPYVACGIRTTKYNGEQRLRLFTLNLKEAKT